MDPNDRVAVKLVDADFAILSELRKGRNLAANIADELDYSRKYINGRMSYLLSYDLVEKIGIKDSGLYQLTPRGFAAYKNRDKYRSDQYDRVEFGNLIDDFASRVEYTPPQFQVSDVEE